MINKRVLFYLGAVIGIVLLSIAVSPSYRWLIINGAQATSYSKQLLAGGNPGTPDWAIDLVVIKKSNSVSFGEHNSNNIYSFSPSHKPKTANVVWSPLWGAWYVSSIKT